MARSPRSSTSAERAPSRLGPKKTASKKAAAKKKAVTKKAATKKKAVTKKAATKRTVTKRAATKKKAATKRAVTKRAATKKAVGTRSGSGRGASRPARPTDSPRFRSGRAMRAGLVVATIGAGAGLAAIPVSDWVDQQAELDQAEQRREELQTEIDGIEREIAAITGDAGIEERSLCFGPYVRPGTETYTVPGVSGCVDPGD